MKGGFNSLCVNSLFSHRFFSLTDAFVHTPQLTTAISNAADAAIKEYKTVSCHFKSFPF